MVGEEARRGGRRDTGSPSAVWFIAREATLVACCWLHTLLSARFSHWRSQARDNPQVANNLQDPQGTFLKGPAARSPHGAITR